MSEAPPRCKSVPDGSLRVVRAAIRVGELIVSMPRPARHHTIIHELHGLGCHVRDHAHEQGFVLSPGAFVGRRQAARLAWLAGQIEEIPRSGQLYSEDLW